MKKLLTLTIASLAVAAMLVLSAGAIDFSVSPAATGEILGDGNGDGAINARDILAIKRDVVNIEKARVGADANADGKINARDILAIKRQIVGIEQLTDIAGSKVKILAVDDVNLREMTIVAPAGTDTDTDNIAYAAEELQKYLYRATSVRVPIVYAGESPTEHAFYLIKDPTIQGNEQGELGLEGFTIETKDGNVYITGGMYRGCMYGVYEFLEEYVGVRFVANDETYFYKADIINLKNGILDTQIPQFMYRYVGGTESDTVPVYYLPNKQNAKAIWTHSESYYGYNVGPHFFNAHSWGAFRDDMWPRQPGNDDWEKRGTYYHYNWQPCFKNDYEEMFRGLMNYSDMIFKEWKQPCIPGQSQFTFSSNDNTQYCQCADCRETYDRIGITGASVEFASRAADEYQEYYPGIKLYTIFYDKTPPADGIYVSDNLVIMYCGTGCNNHIPGTGDCGDNVTVLGTSNKIDEVSLPAWCKIADEVYFWEYGITYMSYLAPCPCIFNIWHDIKFVAENGGVGLYYEGGTGISFEELKNYIAAKMSWDTDMSFEELEYLIQEYLFIRYGEGYEEIYEIIKLMDEAGNDNGCFINNHDYPWEMYNKATLAKYSDRILELLATAKSKTVTDAQAKRLERTSLHIQFLDLSATYEEKYVNGTEAQRADYAARYEWLWTYLKENNIPIFAENQRTLPATCNLESGPMEQFYGGGYSG